MLSTIHSQAPTLAVLLNLATGSNVVAREGESIVLPAYRALLERLGYSRNILLAELEFDLERDGRLEEFEHRFAEATGKPWTERRYTSLAKNEASRALYLLDQQTYPQPDSWAKSVSEPEINADWFVARALELLERRGHGASRLAFIVDEAGQYAARSVQRMLDLQGLAEACQKKTGRIWLAVTSQERLNDVVDSLESKQVELARAQARFPLRVDLLPSDIDEVTGKRVLDKTDAGQQAVRDIVAPRRHQARRQYQAGLTHEGSRCRRGRDRPAVPACAIPNPTAYRRGVGSPRSRRQLPDHRWVQPDTHKACAAADRTPSARTRRQAMSAHSSRSIAATTFSRSSFPRRGAPRSIRLPSSMALTVSMPK